VWEGTVPLTAIQSREAQHIGVAIVSYNTVDLLRACLQSLAESTVGVGVVVVDNGSTDESVAMMATSFRW
jgi:GT2 family glycosyltransferase